jgi:anti-sigma B factor antagonist
MLDTKFSPFEACLVRCSDDGAVVAMRGELDVAAVPKLQAVLDVALSKTCRLTLDLRDLTFMGSAGLAALASAHQRVGQIKEAIVLYRPSPMVVRLLEITSLDSCFDIRTDRLLEDSARRSIDENLGDQSAWPEAQDCIDIRMEFGLSRGGSTRGVKQTSDPAAGRIPSVTA